MNEDNETRFRAVLAGLNDGAASIMTAVENAQALAAELPTSDPMALALLRVTRRQAAAETLADDLAYLHSLSRWGGA